MIDAVVVVKEWQVVRLEEKLEALEAGAVTDKDFSDGLTVNEQLVFARYGLYLLRWDVAGNYQRLYG